MANKITARKLLYNEALLRYGLECKVEKDNEKDFSLMLIYGNRVFSNAAKNGTIFSRN